MKTKMKFLIVVDMQNDFVTGPLGSQEAQALVTPIGDRIKEANNVYDLVLFTKDTHYDDYLNTLEGQKLPIKHCIEGTPGWCIVKSLSTLVCKSANGCLLYSNEKFGIEMNRIKKITFGSDNLINFIKANKDIVEEVELCGVCTDICVISNALAIRQVLPNMKITVNANLCAGTTPEKHRAALEVMKSCQIDIIE